MKLLFDQNLAPRLVGLLDDLFPSSQHVRDVGLAAVADAVVWDYAKAGVQGRRLSAAKLPLREPA